MGKFFFLGAFGLGLLSGCVNTVTEAQQLEMYRLNCQNNYGFNNDTQKMIECVQELDEEARQIQRAKLKAFSDLMRDSNKNSDDGSSTSSYSSSSSSSYSY
ncbi:MAG TPA: hypothetical protein DCM25_08115 [Rhodobacteraceae bacterium]|nr:hypothetical protein [Paracoccaceae bacterium]